MKSTLVELVMVMTLLVLFGTTLFTLMYAGAGTQERILSEKDAQMDARITLSYINVKLRQNDSAGKIAVAENALTGENAIVIRERTLDYEYDTWIFYYDGKLYECLTDPDAAPTELDSFFIVDTDGLLVEWDADTGAITNTVYYYYNDIRQQLTSTVYLRSYSWRVVVF